MTENTIEFTDGVNNNEEFSRKGKKRKIGHPVWQYLSWNADRTLIICNLCQQQYSLETGVNIIKGHFAINHRDEWMEINQQTAPLVKPVGQHDNMDAERIAKANALLIRWIICDQQPFSVVEEDSFRDLISALNSQHKLLSQQAISMRVQRMYEKLRDVLKAYFSNLDSKVALTTDILTTCTDQAYMFIALHWIDDEWRMRRILIDMIPLDDRHTSIVLANAIYAIINNFSLNEKIISVTSADNTSTMDDGLGCELMKILSSNNHGNALFRHITCAVHILNLVAKSGLREAERLITKVREFTVAIYSSQTIFDELRGFFKMKGVDFSVPGIDIHTCWNSTYLMLEGLQRIRDATDLLVVSNPLLKNLYPSEDDWKELNTLTALLEPIYQATNLLSTSSYPTLGDLRMIFLVITDIIHESQREDEAIGKRIAGKMKEKLNGYWEGLKSTFHEAVILDPNNKLALFKLDADKREARNMVCTTYQVNYAIENMMESSESESPRAFFHNYLKRARGMFIGYDDPLEEYLNSPVEDVDILMYWKAKSTDSRWAPLARMARDYLVIQTSVSCEQLFSVERFTSIIHLEPEEARASLCLKTWFEMELINE